MPNVGSSIKAALQAVSGLAVLAKSRLLRVPQPMRAGRLRLQGVSAPVEIIRDRWDVPHIFARSEADALFAQGFVHAQERLWQMDFNRRLVAGRLSEILGSVALPLDRWMRILGLRRSTEGQESMLGPELRSLLERYVAGINAVIAKGPLPVEFDLLGFSPEPWSFTDSLSWQKMMAWTLCVNWEGEVLRARLIAKFGQEKAAELEAPYIEGGLRIIPPGMDYSCIGSEALRRAADARRFTGPSAREGLGSNNWVLSGSRTDTGMPLLANDMHLGMTIPAVWYENHIVGGKLNIAGVSFAGIPLVVAGHNSHVAWGFTDGFTDVQDLYMERLRRTDDGRVQYEFQDSWVEAEVLQEKIEVKGGTPVTQEVILTRHGPIINGLAPEDFGEQPLALRWTAFEKDTMLDSLLQMARAGDCTEFRNALRGWSVPSQNTVYADTLGNIGYSLPGKLPMRARGDGRVPVPGWTGEYEWLGYVPFEELPHLYNPPQGYIASANNRVVGDDYPHWIGYDHCAGYRAERIVELIEKQPKIDVGYICSMQVDQVSKAAQRMARVFDSLHSDDPDIQRVVELMRNWDGSLAPHGAQAAVYEVFTLRLISLLLSTKLGDLAIRYSGKGPVPVLQETSIFGERSREWLEFTLTHPDSPWFDLGDGRSRDELILEALGESIAFLKTTCGSRTADWSWDKLHQITFGHSLGSVKPLDRFFNRGPFPLGGDYDTIWASGATRHDLSHDLIVGPPFRYVADLRDWNKSLSMLAPGQSGHPMSPHYADNIQRWLRGEYHPMLFDREAVLAEADATLIIDPA
jgi:penicillin amidase